uniref:Uncharacterized protein n=2 Tax=Oryza glumipatula TaxID=40148 RepID=A0A0E0B2I3_9ORYZ
MVQIPWICRREVTWIGVVLSPYSPAPVPRILFGGGVGPPIREDLGSEVMRRTLFWGEDLMSMEDVQCSKSESFFFTITAAEEAQSLSGWITINNSLLLYAGSSAIRLVDRIH